MDLALRATKHTARAVGHSMAGSVVRFGRRRKFFSLTPPSLKLGCLGRQSALWWRNFSLPSHSRLPSGSLCLGGRGTHLTLPPPLCLESAPCRERSPPSEYNTPLPLLHFFHEWERLSGVSSWVLCTVRSSYTLQFGRNSPPPCFYGVHQTVVSSTSKTSVLQQELSSLLIKGAIEEVPQSDLERGFFTFLCQRGTAVYDPF